MVKGLVFDIDRFSLHEGPGVRAAVFLKGCPLNCVWCHSPESQKNTPEIIYQSSLCVNCGKCLDFTLVDACAVKALSICGEWRDAREVLETILPDKPFYENSGGGVTVTGGEPLVQAEFTKHLLELSVKSGIHTALETCGHGSRDMLLEIAGWCDLIFYDVKIVDHMLHRQYTGVGNELILSNLSALCDVPGYADKVIIRVPCVPGLNDSPEQIAEIAQLARRHGIRRIELLPYNPSAGAKYEWLQRAYELKDVEPRPQDYYDELTKITENILRS